MRALPAPTSDAPSSPSGALVLWTDPFRSEASYFVLDPEETIAQALDRIVDQWRARRVRVTIGGQVVPPEWYEYARPNLGTWVDIQLLPRDPRGTAGSVGLLALSIAGTFLTGGLASPVAGALGVGTGLVRGVGVLVTLAAALAGSFIAPGPKEEEENESFGIARFRNAIQPWGTPPYVRGYVRAYPKKAGQAIIENRGRLQILRELFDFGPGPMLLSDFRNGDRFLGNFQEDGSVDGPDDFGGYDGFRVEWIEGADADRLKRNFYYGDTYTEDFGLELRQPGLFEPGVEEEINPPLLVDGFDLGDPGTYALAEGTVHPDDYALVNRYERRSAEGSPINYQSFTVGTGTTRADEIIVNVTFPGGIFATTDQGETDSAHAAIGVIVQHGRQTLADGSPDPDYQRVYLATHWNELFAFANPQQGWPINPFDVEHPALQGAFRFGDNFTAPLYHEIRLNIQVLAGFTDDEGEEQVYSGPFVLTIWRMDQADQRETSQCTVETIRIHDYTDAHRLEGHCLAQVFVRATGQLNGQMDEFNAWARSKVAHPENNWSTAPQDLVPSNDPFLLAADTLLRAPNLEDIGKHRINLDAFEDAYIANRRPDGTPWRPFNFVFDTRINGKQLVDDILRVARSRLTLPDGRYTPVIDGDTSGETIRQLITVRNQRDFSREITFLENPADGLRVRFLNQEFSSVEDELIVPAPGLTLNQAGTFEQLDVKGITTWQMAWLVAAEAHLEARLRREDVTVTVDIDHLVCTVGDVVGIVHPVIDETHKQVARVEDVDTDAGVLTLDTPIEMEAGTDYFARWNLIDGGRMVLSPTYAVALDTGMIAGGVLKRPTTITITDSVSASDWPDVGDQIAIGPQPDPQRYKVRSIEPRAGMSARLTLMPEANGIHDPFVQFQGGTNPTQEELRVQDPHKWPEPVTNLTVTVKPYIIGWRYYSGDLNADPVEEHVDHPQQGQELTLAQFDAALDDDSSVGPIGTEDGNVLIDYFLEISFDASPTEGLVRYSIYTLEENEKDPLPTPAPQGALWFTEQGGLDVQIPQPPPENRLDFLQDPGIGEAFGWPEGVWFGVRPPDNPDVTEIARYRLWVERTGDLSARLGQPLKQDDLQTGTQVTLVARLDRMPIGRKVTISVTATSKYGEMPLEHAPRVVLDGATDALWDRMVGVYATTVKVAIPEISPGGPLDDSEEPGGGGP